MAAPLTTVGVDIRADLQNEDETGYVWAYLDRAVHPGRISVGNTVIAGNSGGRCLARVIDIVDGPGGPSSTSICWPAASSSSRSAGPAEAWQSSPTPHWKGCPGPGLDGPDPGRSSCYECEIAVPPLVTRMVLATAVGAVPPTE